MSWEIRTLPDFDRSAKRLAKKYRSLPSDLKGLLNELRSNPHSGTEIMPGIRKIRMAIVSKGKGKSGGARIISYDVCVKEEDGVLYLLCLYDKNEMDNINTDYIRQQIELNGLDKD